MAALIEAIVAKFADGFAAQDVVDAIKLVLDFVFDKIEA